MKDLIYVTGNEYKLYTARKFLTTYGINVIGKKIECPEIQADSIEEVAKYSAEYACSKMNCAVLKNDMGLVIPALNGFPAAYTHYVEDTLEEDGILKLMSDIDNREAYFFECLAYAEPGKETKVFISKTSGRLDTKKTENMDGAGIESLFQKDKMLQWQILMTTKEQSYGLKKGIKI